MACLSTSLGALNAFIQPAHSHKNGFDGSILTGGCCCAAVAEFGGGDWLTEGGAGLAEGDKWSPLVNGGVCLALLSVNPLVVTMLL